MGKGIRIYLFDIAHPQFAEAIVRLWGLAGLVKMGATINEFWILMDSLQGAGRKIRSKRK